MSKILNLVKSFAQSNVAKTIYIYLIMAICIFGSESSQDNFQVYSIIILTVLLAPVILFKIIKRDFFKIFNSRSFVIALFLVFFLGLAFVFKSRNYFFAYVRLIGVAFIAFVIIGIFDKKELCKTFANLMLIIAVFSLILYSYINITGIQSGNLYTDGTYNYYSYYYFFYSISTAMTKNHGVFWEPGIYSTYLILGFIIEYCLKRRGKIAHIILFSITTITTFSLAGIIIFIELILFLLIKRLNNKKFSLIYACFLILIFVGLYIVLPYLPNNMLQIFEAITKKGESFTTRLLSIKIDMQIFRSSPIFGVGSGYPEIFRKLVASSEKYSGLIDCSVSTFGYFFGAAGLFGLVYLSSTIIPIFEFKKIDLSTKLFLWCVFFQFLSKEPHTLSFIIWMIIFATNQKEIIKNEKSN